MNRQLPDDFKEFLRFLIEENVEFLLIGGYAVGFHGHPRATGDMDVWIARNAANAARVIRALERFGFTHGEASSELFLEEGNVIRMGFPPMRIEILNQIDGVSFGECYARRVEAKLDGVNTPVISIEDLLKNNEASGRPKDLADIDALK